MCGIAGMIDYKNNINKYISDFMKMQATLKRRGPDQDGMYIEVPAALIHARLSVVDLENGKQPMFYRNGNEEYIIVYNGELYNTEDIRTELTGLGHKFIGHSDTEVLLHSYAEWKGECVKKLNGIFAFAVWEKHSERLFFARDRIGVKPLFYSIKDGAFIFASEIKTMLACPLIEPKINTQSIAEIILIGPGRTPGYGVFCDIKEVLPAHCGYFDKNGLHIHQYWSLTDRQHTDTFEQTVEKVRYLVTDSIERQLVSDVPVGTFLSGGLDSSIISAIAARYIKNKGVELQTFSVDYVDNEKYFTKSKFQPNSDYSYIEIMNKYLGVKHHRILLDTEKLVSSLYDAVDARDLPGMADVDSSLLLFCKEIKNHITVALSGECADEIFGGYPWYRDKEIRERYGFPWAQSTDYRHSFLRQEFAEQINSHNYVDERYKATLHKSSVLKGTEKTEHRMKEMINLNLEWFMQTLLDRKDRMSMYNGLEVRVPFCDYRIAEYLYTVPWEYKDYNGREKGLLRMAMQDLLPDEVLWRKKSPYPKTHNPSYLQAVSNKLREIIADPKSKVLQFVKKEALESLLNTDNPVPWYGQLMTTPQTIAYFIQINYWLEKYNIKVE